MSSKASEKKRVITVNGEMGKYVNERDKRSKNVSTDDEKHASKNNRDHNKQSTSNDASEHADLREADVHNAHVDYNSDSEKNDGSSESSGDSNDDVETLSDDSSFMSESTLSMTMDELNGRMMEMFTKGLACQFTTTDEHPYVHKRMGTGVQKKNVADLLQELIYILKQTK